MPARTPEHNRPDPRDTWRWPDVVIVIIKSLTTIVGEWLRNGGGF